MAKVKPATEGNEEVNKSEEIRSLLKSNPKMPAKEVQDTLAKQGIKVASSQIYFIKGQTQGRKTPGAKPTKTTNGVAPKAEASKSEEVRRILKENPEMSAKEVQEALAKKGVTVTGALVYFVKGKVKGTKQRQGAKSKAAAAKASPARKSEVNKSHEVRELLAQNPKTPAKEIQDSLAKRGIKVSSNLIYLLKSKAGAKKRRQKRDADAKVASTNGHADPIATIRKVKALASEVGGMTKLRHLVEALSE